jgi:hypothetical protein
MWAVVAQATTAGRLLTGDEWARDLHRGGAGVLVGVTIAGGATALIRLRDRRGGRRYGLTLLGAGIAMYVEFQLGTAAADGKDTIWLHLPVGVALVVLLAHAMQLARRVGDPPSVR